MIEGLDMDAMSECTDQQLRPPGDSDVVFTPKARGYVKGLVTNTLSLAKFHSGCNVSEKSFATLNCKTGRGDELINVNIKMKNHFSFRCRRGDQQAYAEEGRVSKGGV